MTINIYAGMKGHRGRELLFREYLEVVRSTLVSSSC